MEKFYNNTPNGKLKFKVNVVGTESEKLDIRLVFNGKSINATRGILEGEYCVFDVPALDIYESGLEGELFIEAIHNEQYFKVWESDFLIESKTEILAKSNHLQRTAVSNIKSPLIKVEENKIEREAPVSNINEKKNKKDIGKVINESDSLDLESIVNNMNSEVSTFRKKKK